MTNTIGLVFMMLMPIGAALVIFGSSTIALVGAYMMFAGLFIGIPLYIYSDWKHYKRASNIAYVNTKEVKRDN